ncbi:methionyl-tRNA formyltransferase [Daejeonella lutea]|uniref:Methionyl-tRNA formyltransferase n=1 Tax=Daejeonella lutea TaxID=572036 RepID=A0A1T5A2G3_9SPHI|nr:methionyl-tRNA formyltransferase [Daejeonella lutea]SKB29158.1 methionyl-tRNA formyltransferase [Daejeonella lutea]
MRIVFMGTPDFAVASLRALVENGCDIVGVITAPDKPAGRGQKLNESAVKKYATEQGLNVLQPQKLKDPLFIEHLRSLNADLQVIVAFRMLPEIVWAMPPLGTINLHASLLPQYRGAAPINWAIINGERETGVSTFFLKQEIDTGDLLLSQSVNIDKTDTAGDLHDKLMETGAHLLLKTVTAIQERNYKEYPQPSELDLKTAPKIFKEDCLIKWNQPVETVFNFIRGLSPYPTAFTYLQEKTLKVFRADIEKSDADLEPGKVLTDNKTYLKFSCTDGIISVLELQLEGKKRMKVDEFLRGVRL